MPYIKQEYRKEIDPIVEALHEKIVELLSGNNEGIPGILNYTITKLLLSCTRMTLSYYTINAMLGVLEAIKQEFYRRLAAPYEDKKKKENGDVF